MEPRLVRFEGFEGIHLVADVWGDDRDWPVLLMHGGGQTRHAWGSTAQTLARHGWRTVSLDLRGHGDSEWALNGDYSFTAYGADCVAVVDQLGRPPVLVGASLGGITALLAEGGSDRVVSSGLVIVDVTHRANPAGVQRIRDFMALGRERLRHARRGRGSHRRLYTPSPAAREPRGAHEGAAPAARTGAGTGTGIRGFSTTGAPRSRAGSSRRCFDAAIRNIAVPTLLVRGKLSDVVTEEGVQEFLRHIPGAKLVDVSGAAHMVAGDQNDAFSQAVIDFLERDIRPTLAR